MESDKWEVVSGKWRVASGRVASGEWERRGQDTPTAAATARRPPTCTAARSESDALP